MRARWAALLSSAGLLLGSASASAQAPLALSPFQLDGVVPAYQYDPSRYQLRLSVEDQTVPDPDRAHDLMAMDDIVAEQMLLEQPEARCTPARRALLAFAGNSESAAPEAIAARGLVLGTSASPAAAAASPAPARRDQRLAAADAGSAAVSSRSRSVSLTSAGSGARQIAVDGGQQATVARLGASGRQALSGNLSRRPVALRAGDAGRRAPTAASASRAPTVAAPSRTVRSDTAARPATTSAVRLTSGVSASDVLARARARVDRTMSRLGGGSFGMRR